MAVLKRCPWCESRAVRPHCRNERCTWVACVECDSFGTPDGLRRVTPRRNP